MAQPMVPPSQRAASGELPGSQSMRPSQNQALISLVRLMGNSFIQLGEQMQKAPNVDPMQMTRASAVLRQAQMNLRKMGGGGQQAGPQGPVDMASSAGRPQPVDKQVDPMTRRSMSGQLQSGMPNRL